MPGVIAVALINAQLYGSPLSSGYGHWSELFALSRVSTNLRLYLHVVRRVAHAPGVCGFFALFVPLRRLWPAVGNRDVFIVMAGVVLVVWATYCAWLIFEDWWYQRFLLTSWPFLMLGTGAVLVFAYRAGASFVRAAVVVTVVALGLYQLDTAMSLGVVRQPRRPASFCGRREARATGDGAKQRNREPRPLRIHPLLRRPDDDQFFGSVPDQSFDAVVDWLSAHGVRTYLALEEWELAEVRQRFGANRCMRVLDRPPVAVLEWPGKMQLFDLTGTRQETAPIVARPAPGPLATAGPVAPARLVLTPAP